MTRVANRAMARKSTPRRSGSPVSTALTRLATLSGAGSAPGRMVREAQKIMADWRAEPDLDADVLRERLETLREDLMAGVSAAEEQAGDVDRSDAGAVRQAEASLKGLQAVRDAVAAELG